MLMERLLRSSVKMRVHINEIEDSLSPVREVHIVKALEGIQAAVDYMEGMLKYYIYGLTELLQRFLNLKKLMYKLKSVFVNLPSPKSGLLV
ncbi:hypothetical protein CDL15_Pgr023944 [Punica granatum]|nr:hypothetical protein CDL15_Pgr023944 [Punica granatum]